MEKFEMKLKKLNEYKQIITKKIEFNSETTENIKKIKKTILLAIAISTCILSLGSMLSVIFASNEIMFTMGIVFTYVFFLGGACSALGVSEHYGKKIYKLSLEHQKLKNELSDIVNKQKNILKNQKNIVLEQGKVNKETSKNETRISQQKESFPSEDSIYSEINKEGQLIDSEIESVLFSDDIEVSAKKR